MLRASKAARSRGFSCTCRSARTTLPGVVEDVTEIAQRQGDRQEPQPANPRPPRRAEPARRDHRAHVQTDNFVEVINKDHVLATLTDDVPFVMEMVVENERATCPRPSRSSRCRKSARFPSTPRSARSSASLRCRRDPVGQKTNYDKLTFEIWTDDRSGRKWPWSRRRRFSAAFEPVRQYTELGSKIHAEARASGQSGSTRRPRPSSR